jgi:hypothetical protein
LRCVRAPECRYPLLTITPVMFGVTILFALKFSPGLAPSFKRNLFSDKQIRRVFQRISFQESCEEK